MAGFLFNDETGIGETPLARAKYGPAYPQLGIGTVLLDWDWCPLWWTRADSDIRLAGYLPQVIASRLRDQREVGELSAVIRGRLTEVGWGVLRLMAQLDAAVSKYRRDHPPEPEGEE
jgi:hypothetical protein